MGDTRPTSLRSIGGGVGCAVCAFVTLFVMLAAMHFIRDGGGTSVLSLGPAVTQLEKLGDLTVLRVHVSDVLEADDGDYRGAWLIKGDALMSVDLRRARIIAKDDDKKHAVIELPPVRVIQPRVNFDRTKTWVVEKVTLIPFKGNPDRLRDSAMKQAQLLVEQFANASESLDQAKLNAETLIRNMYAFVGWDVVVKWSDPK